MPVPDSISVNACRRAFLGHLLQLKIVITGFLAVAPDKDREFLSWLFEPHFEWDAVVGSLTDSETPEAADPGSSRHTSWHLFLCTRVQALTKFLNASNSAEGQRDAQVPLESLGHSNSKSQSQDSKAS